MMFARKNISKKTFLDIVSTLFRTYTSTTRQFNPILYYIFLYFNRNYYDLMDHWMSNARPMHLCGASSKNATQVFTSKLCKIRLVKCVHTSLNYDFIAFKFFIYMDLLWLFSWHCIGIIIIFVSTTIF